jgi:hypothetical protein
MNWNPLNLTQDDILLIIKVVCGVVTCVTTGLSILATIFGGKWKGLYKNVKAVNEKTNKLIELIELAETHDAYSSDDKLQFVVSNYRQYCYDSKIPFVEQDTIDQINELVDMTNNVNKGVKLSERRQQY